VARPTKKLTIQGKLLCVECKVEYPLDKFSKDSRSAIGFQTICKKCEKKYRETHKSERKEYLLKTQKQRSKQMLEYLDSHRESVNRWRRSYYANEGHLKILAASEERRSKKIATSDGSVTPKFLEALYLIQDGKCNNCGSLFKKGKNSFHVDHVMPLAKGGVHKDDNIQLLCPSCNLSKGASVGGEILAGRPTKYDPAIDIAIILDKMKEGCSITEACAVIGISRDTLYKWKKKYPLFSDAIKKGEELSLSWWLREGRKNLKDKDFNATLFYMNMKNRHGWADKTESKNDTTLKTEPVTVNFIRSEDAGDHAT